MATVETLFWRFRQNNSGGSFDIDEQRGIGVVVYVEAVDATHANSRAESIGIYFDGCDKGMDCSCCGDRWYLVRPSDGESKAQVDARYDFDWHHAVYVHRLDGSIERLQKDAA